MSHIDERINGYINLNLSNPFGLCSLYIQTTVIRRSLIFFQRISYLKFSIKIYEIEQRNSCSRNNNGIRNPLHRFENAFQKLQRLDDLRPIRAKLGIKVVDNRGIHRDVQVTTRNCYITGERSIELVRKVQVRQDQSQSIHYYLPVFIGKHRVLLNLTDGL
jgi:hypothetical protein